ncbi:MAG: aldo/keto reductase [Eubacteriales bacterium]
MYYKQYGNTDMKVSAIGLGLMRYDDEDVKAGRFEKCAEIPLYALEQGINYWDTAPFYCDDKSEIITGKAVSQIKRSDIYLTSKANMGTWGTEAPTRDDFRKRLDMSLTRLNTDYLDFYHIWCMLSLESFEKHIEKVYGFYEEARSEGLIKNIVFSSHMSGGDLTQAVEYNEFKGMLIGYNALNYRFRQSGIERAHDKGMGVVVMNPLSGGMIPQNQDKFKYLTEGTDLTVPQAALRFVASHKEITITLAGCTTKAHVDDAVKAVENLKEMPAREIVAKYADMGDAYNNLCTSCGYCNVCPKGIEIPKYMDVYNSYLLSGKKAGIDRMQDMWGFDETAAKTCVACGKCESKCTQHLPIIERLKEIGTRFEV